MITREEQKELVRHLFDDALDSIIDNINDGDIPEEWDGHELRAYAAYIFRGKASRSVITTDPKSKRAKDFNNLLIVSPRL